MKFVFDEVLKDVKQKIENKEPIYGDSWKTMPVYKLANRLKEEYAEWEAVDNNEDDYKEVLDVIAVALMFATRLKQGAQ